MFIMKWKPVTNYNRKTQFYFILIVIKRWAIVLLPTKEFVGSNIKIFVVKYF